MHKLTIAIDCDDVLVPTAALLVTHYNKTYGTNIGLKDIYSKDFSAWGVPNDRVAMDRIEAYLMSQEYQQTSPPAEAIKAVRALSKSHSLHIITGRSDALAEVTKAMLDQYFPNAFTSVQFTSFFGQKKPHSKAQVCQELGADLLIDDHLHHAAIVASCGIPVLLFGDYPWNQATSLPTNVQRVKDWQAAVAAVTASTLPTSMKK